MNQHPLYTFPTRPKRFKIKFLKFKVLVLRLMTVPIQTKLNLAKALIHSVPSIVLQYIISQININSHFNQFCNQSEDGFHDGEMSGRSNPSSSVRVRKHFRRQLFIKKLDHFTTPNFQNRLAFLQLLLSEMIKLNLDPKIF